LYKLPNACCKIGTVLYGHLDQRENNAPNWSIYNYPYPNNGGKNLGKFPQDCNCGCSTGIHLHTECKGGIRNPLSCGQQVTGNSSWFYRFNVPETCDPCPQSSIP
jgi:hypothetical protein